jgi:ABC-type nitrate/sulfonate/bicarbonate transport system permease component
MVAIASTQSTRGIKLRVGVLGALRRWLPPVLGTLFFAALWEVLTRTHALPQEIPPLTTVISKLISLLGDPGFWVALRQTLTAWILGLAVSAAIGVALGVAIGTSWVVRELTYGVVEFLRPLPPLIYLPLAILVMGATTKTTVFLVVTSAVWPILLQTATGIRDADPVLKDMARAYRFSARDRILAVTLPGAGPFVATGLRLSASMALIVAVGVELLGTGNGMGGAMFHAEQFGDYPTLFAYAVAAGVLGLAMNAVLVRGEARLFSWAPAYRTKESR